MNKKFKVLNIFDCILIIIIVVCSIGLYSSFKYFIEGSEASIVNVYYENKLVATLDLNQDQTLLLSQSKYPSLLADLEIEVKNRKVQISKETSPNNICSKQGWSDSPLKPLVCLPNKVMVTVDTGEIVVDGIDFEVGD